MKIRYYTAILLASLAILAGCSKGDNPKPDETDGEIWYPEKSQPGIFTVPDALKNNTNDYARQAYEGVKVLENLIATYSDYFLAPEGTKNTSLTSALGYQYAYSKGDHTVEYMYGDFVTSHRMFELEAKDVSGKRLVLITGDWWENWNAADGKSENGKHYGNMRYSIGAGDTAQTMEFSWIDDGGGNYRVTCNVWKPGQNNGLDIKYEFTFNADRSGGYLYTEWLPNGNLQYRTEWESSGSGSLIMMSGPNAGTYAW